MSRFPGYARTVVVESGAEVAARVRGLESYRPDTLPILVMLHGYPQTSLCYRDLVHLLPSFFPLYIPDLPGSGESRTSNFSTYIHSARVIGTDLLNSLIQHITPTSLTNSRISIILIGHDRGARVAHRLSIDNDHAHFNIIGTVLLDIVPTVIQFQTLGVPENATSLFHWGFLGAKHPLPERMITAYGGSNFAHAMLSQSAGSNPDRRNKVLEHFTEYARYNDLESVIRSTCEDHRAAATVDCQEHAEDQREGRKMNLEVLVVYSERYLGRRYDVPGVWERWIGRGRITARAVGDGVGHFLLEEAPEVVQHHFLEWARHRLRVRI